MAAKVQRYLQLIKADTVYARHMRALSKMIFSEPPENISSKNMKVITLFSQKPVNKRPEIVNYYLTNNNVEGFVQQLAAYGLYRDVHAEFKAYTQKKREQRGKYKWVPPKFREAAEKSRRDKSE